MKTLAHKTGFTEAYLSQVETGRASPTLASLKRIASAYGLSMVELLIDDPPVDDTIVLRRKDRRRLLQAKGGIVKELLVRRQGGGSGWNPSASRSSLSVDRMGSTIMPVRSSGWS